MINKEKHPGILVDRIKRNTNLFTNKKNRKENYEHKSLLNRV